MGSPFGHQRHFSILSYKTVTLPAGSGASVGTGRNDCFLTATAAGWRLADCCGGAGEKLDGGVVGSPAGAGFPSFFSFFSFFGIGGRGTSRPQRRLGRRVSGRKLPLCPLEHKEN